MLKRLSGLVSTGLIAVGVVAGCDGDSAGSPTPLPPDVPDISGRWVLAIALDEAETGVRCAMDGSAEVVQEGERFRARVSSSEATCNWFPSGSSVFPDSGASYELTDGRVDGDEVAFSDERCVYEGGIEGTPPNVLHGPLTCIFNGFPDRARGHWWLTRPADSPGDPTGDWVFVGTLSESVACVAHGTFRLDQTGDSVTGVVRHSYISCLLPYADGDLGVGWTGRIDRDNVALSDTFDVCTYSGALRGSPHRISGELVCTVGGLQGEALLHGPGEFARLSTATD
jgi:hypothetical protein